jgi:hypothetical protein
MSNQDKYEFIIIEFETGNVLIDWIYEKKLNELNLPYKIIFRHQCDKEKWYEIKNKTPKPFILKKNFDIDTFKAYFE